MNQDTIESLFQDLADRYARGEISTATNVLAGVVTPPEAADVEPLPIVGSAPHQLLAAEGRRALAAGEVGVVILAGGMATRFNYDKPKGVFPIYEGKSFLQLKIEAVKALGHQVPIYLMTSFATDDAIRAHLEEHDHFGVDPAHIHRFMQYQMPRLAPGGGFFVEDGVRSLAAPGHGDFPYAFRESGLLGAFIAGGGRWLTFSNVDNLGATVDLVILGGHIQAGKAMTVEVAVKNAGDQGGAPARVDGHLQLVEGFAFPAAFDHDSVDVFNTANYVFTARALMEERALPWYVVEKKVHGETVVQFEHLAGDLSVVLSSRYVRIDRDERFLPVKNVADVPAVQAILAQRWAKKLTASI